MVHRKNLFKTLRKSKSLPCVKGGGISAGNDGGIAIPSNQLKKSRLKFRRDFLCFIFRVKAGSIFL